MTSVEILSLAQAFLNSMGLMPIIFAAAVAMVALAVYNKFFKD